MKKNLIYLSNILLIFASGCSTPQSALDATSNGNGMIPSNFAAAKYTLLIEESVGEDNSTIGLSTSTSVQTDTYSNYYMTKKRKDMAEYLDKNYTYKYSFATQDEIYNANSKYADKNVYRFALVTSIVKPNQRTEISSGLMRSTHNQPIFRYYIYDRLENKTYSSLGNGSSLIMVAFRRAIKKLVE